MLKDKTNLASFGGSKYVLVPFSVLQDSKFPFELDEKLTIEIVNNKIVIMKAGD